MLYPLVEQKRAARAEAQVAVDAVGVGHGVLGASDGTLAALADGTQELEVGEYLAEAGLVEGQVGLTGREEVGEGRGLGLALGEVERWWAGGVGRVDAVSRLLFEDIILGGLVVLAGEGLIEGEAGG